MEHSFELGCQQSPRSEPSVTDTTEYSTRSIGDDSFAYCRTSSETSAFSYPADDSSCQEGSSPFSRPLEKKLMWKREMETLLSVCDYIVEFLPAADTFEDGRSVEQEVLESFRDTEFWYADKGSLSSGTMKSTSFRKVTQHKEEKWWLPVPCVPPGGLSEKARKHLQNKRDCANQIHKAAMAINNCILDDMEVPDSYMTSLPKSGRASLGDLIYRYMNTSDKFCPDYVLDCVEIHSEHEALEIADRVEASIYIWRRKVSMSTSKSSWNLMADGEKSDKNHILAGRADTLLLCLKQRYPELSQTTLATCKIQYNKDIGQAILESYSRVLEGLAYNLVAWIEDVLYVDSSAKRKDHNNP